MHFVELTINNKLVSVDSRATILQACETVGVALSRFCYHENLSVAGNCRICLVEVQKSPKPVVACARPVSKGRVIFTDTPLARKARESVLEFLLLNHPLDCPICDQGGECDLQDEAVAYGSDRGRYFEFKRSVENKECGPIVKTIRTRCIHCTRCVRFSTEVAGNEVIGIFGRGEESAIGTYVNSFMNTELSGNLVDLCPVGALTSKPYAYKARSWELDAVETVDFFDARASNIVVYKAASEEILRILPRTDSFYAENWISDRTRYAFDGLKYASKRERKKNYAPGSLDLVMGSQSNLEMAYSAFTYIKAKGLGSVNYTFVSSDLCLDIPFFYTINPAFTNFGQNAFGTIVQIGTNLRHEASLLNTLFRREQSRRGVAYVTIGSFAPLRYVQNHHGNSFRSLYSVYENRNALAKFQYGTQKELAIVMGVNACRQIYSKFFQQRTLNIGKRFFIKTAQKERLGMLHSSVGSLAFSHLGVTPKKIKSNSELTFAQPSYVKNRAARPLENSLMVVKPDFVAEGQSKTLYEANGSIIACHGQRRKHVKVMNEVQTIKSKMNLETTLISFWWAEKANANATAINSFWDSLGFFNDETPPQTYFETIPLPFQFNPFSVNLNSQAQVALVLIAQPVRDFYLDNSRAITSVTIADCALYRNNQTNFAKER